MRLAMRVGAGAAIIGAAVSVAAGVGFGDVAEVDGTPAVLARVAERPDWLWPAVHVAFAMGALLWVWAFVVLADALRGPARLLARLALASLVVGAAAHLVDSALSTGAVTSLADEWEQAASATQPALLDRADLVLDVLDATWATVIAFFHGVPFVLMGAAVARSRRLPGWLGWVAIVAGGGSLVLGLWMMGGADLYPAYVPLAVLLSVWMVAMGVVLWRWSTDPELGEE